MDDVEKKKFLTVPGLELRPFGRPARSQSVYGLRYPARIELQRTESLVVSLKGLDAKTN
jgi:hypothetical protein